MTDSQNFYRLEIAQILIRELVDAHKVWQSKCAPDGIPHWGDLHFLDFDAVILPRMILLDVDDGPGFGQYRYWGSAVASADGRNMTGLRVSELAPPRHAAYSEEQYRWVVAHARPALFVASLGEKSWDRKYEAMLRMPCRSVPGGAVDRVLSVGHYSDVAKTIEDHLAVDIRVDDYFVP